MEELDVNDYLIRENLFELFKIQLKKDFDSCSLSTDFIDNLPSQLLLSVSVSKLCLSSSLVRVTLLVC